MQMQEVVRSTNSPVLEINLNASAFAGRHRVTIIPPFRSCVVQKKVSGRVPLLVGGCDGTVALAIDQQGEFQCGLDSNRKREMK